MFKEKNLTNERSEKSPLLSVRRSEILYREDIKETFAYALVGLTITVGVAGVGYIFIKQLLK